ncbi:MAG TPA: FtsQ-type POTRA domain-containing protein [Kiritimatiellia bacterium]|nr:FtsQ-type POTRA domain-containing protein [Kiritimatiellia bacterium]
MWFLPKKNNRRGNYNRVVLNRRSPVYTVHARAAERRSELMHKVGAVALAVVALSGVSWAIAAGGGQIRQWLFTQNTQFIIKNVEISSNGRLTGDHIKEFAGVIEGQNLFDIDILQVRKKLEEGPLIKKAEVQRRLPGTLVLRVSERIPLARIAHGQAGFFFSVDRDGHVLGLAGRQLAAMPLVTGFSDRGLSPGSVLRDGGAIDALNVISMCDAAPISQAIRISVIDVSNPDYLNLTLDSGTRVLLPRNPPRSKLEDLVLFLREAGGRKTFFDLTVDRNIPAT